MEDDDFNYTPSAFGVSILSGSQKAHTMGRLRTCPRHPRLLKITCNIHMVKKLLDFTCSLNRHNISTRACQGCQIFLILYTSPSRKLNHLGFGSSTANPLPLTLYLYTNLHSFCRPQLLIQELINPPNSTMTLVAEDMTYPPRDIP